MMYDRSSRKGVQRFLLLVLALLAVCLPAQPGPQTDTGLQPEVGHLLPPRDTAPERLRVVSFNVHYARDLPALADSIRNNPNLQAADVFLVQEIESYPSEGTSRTRKLAEALRLNYVYAPARYKEEGEGTHGLAILSRFPLRDIEVIPLKQYNLGYNTRRRIALAATVDVAGRPLRLYNVHLDTRINTGRRIEQLRTVVDNARAQPIPEALIGGDFNTNPFYWLLPVFPVFRSNQAKAVDEFMKKNGFETPFARAGTTLHKRMAKFRVDAVYSRGLAVVGFAVEQSVTVSDHFPLWVDVAWKPAPAAEN